MEKFDSEKLLIERSKMFEGHFGKIGEYKEGKVDFPFFPGKCSLSYANKNSMMSRSYFLSLQSETDLESIDSNKKSYCYLNRLGNWKLKGVDNNLKSLHSNLKENSNITKLLSITDLESITILLEKGKIKFSLNLYGGGYSAMMLPPIKINIGIPKNQITPSAKLFKFISDEINNIA